MKINKLILSIILLLFASIKIFQIWAQKGIFWDSAVYIGMGKYMFSLGKIGLWEPARPLIWPLFLGFIWKIGINPILGGRILELALAVGCICLTYMIGKTAFNEKVALLASFFVAASQAFLFFSSSILTEIPSTFLALLSFNYLKKNHFLVGLFAAAAIMLRFQQLPIILPLGLFILYKRKAIGKFILGMITVTFPYLLLNTILYKNPFYPFLFQFFMTKTTGWIYNAPLSFYLINIIKENYLLIFSIVGAVIILKKNNKIRVIILSTFLVFLITLSLIKHKEIRFIITFLPYLSLVAAYGILWILEKIQSKLQWISGAVLILLLLIQTLPQLHTPELKDYTKMREYAKKNPNSLWISNPIFIVDSDAQPSNLLYYPLYDSNKIQELLNKLPEPKNILIDTCDILPCPQYDAGCEEKTLNFIALLQEQYITISKEKENECVQFIFALP
jgi:hypothetical protein